MTHKEIISDFLDFEKENNLINWKLDGIPIWELIRMEVFIKLRSNFISSNINITDKEPLKIISGAKEFILNYFSRNPFRVRKKYNYLILNHSRRKRNAETYVDIYTDSFLKYLRTSDYIVLERFNNLSHLKPTSTNNLHYLDTIEFPSRFISQLPYGLSQNDIEKINSLMLEKWGIEDVLDIRLVKKYIRFFKYLKPKVERLIKKINPKLIIEVVSYTIINQVFNYVAKQNNIPVIELQHGTVGRYHIAYNFKTCNFLETFPDYFFAWGEFWVDKARLPISKENIKIMGFPYIDNFRQKETTIGKDIHQIMVISQLNNEIAVFAYELAKLLPTHKILFKAHPKEYKIAKEKYYTLKKVRNIEIIDNEKITLYDYFKQCNFVFGVSSTALIEALAFGSSIGIIKLPGWEYFEDIEETVNLKFINDATDARLFIRQSEKTQSIDAGSYFIPDSKKRLKKAFKEFLIK